MSIEAYKIEQEIEEVPEHFGRRQYDMQLQKAHTEIAVLHIKVSNLEEKIDEIRKELHLLKEHIDKNNEAMQLLMKEMRMSNNDAHDRIAKKVADLEKWRYMIIGAGIILGSFGLEAVKTLFTM